MLDEKDLLAIQKLFEPVTERLDKVDARLDKVDARLDKLEQHNQKTDERLDRMDARFDQMDARFDRMDERMDQMDGRFDCLEQRVDDMSRSIGVLMDAQFTPRFNLLAENQQIILDKMIPVSRVEALEDEVKFLKVVIRQMNEDIQQLKKAT